MSYKIGKKGHWEYDWSLDTREKIVQLGFQLNQVHTQEERHALEWYCCRLLEEIAMKPCDPSAQHMFLDMYTLIAFTRDCQHGKGLQQIAYMMLKQWDDCFGVGSQEMLQSFVHTYGSWRDIKYFCDYCVHHPVHPWHPGHPLIQFAIQLTNAQVKRDWETYGRGETTTLSLVAKWIPREHKSPRFNWMYPLLVTHYFFGTHSFGTPPPTKAWNKAAREYRHIISTLNKHLGTLETKQCAHQWKTIEFDHVPSVALSKQYRAFLNDKPDNDDRETCRRHFQTFIHQTKPLPSLLSLATIVKEALSLQCQDPMYEMKKKTLQYFWMQQKQACHQTHATEHRIIMIDVSHSMSDEAYHTALGIGCMLADTSALGPYVLTFGGYPQWISLKDCDTIVDQIHHIQRHQSIRNINTHFYSALHYVLDAIRQSHLKHHEIQHLVIVVLSDMQMDAEFPFTHSLHETMQEKNKQINPDKMLPPIRFWNLQTTTGFPCVPGWEMRSGPTLNQFHTTHPLHYQSLASFLDHVIQHELTKLSR